MPPDRFFVYILASRRNGTLYIGMTDDLARRYFQH
jgi:putative endonuclease